MAASVLLSCGLNEKFLPKVVFIPESGNVDSSFLISSLIGHQLKITQTKIVLVCIHHTFDHYNNAGIRIGYSLNHSLEKGRVIPVNILEEIVDDNNFLANIDLSVIFNEIKSTIEEIPSSDDVIVILDDISVLNLFCEKEDLVIKFCKMLIEIVKNRTEKSSLILKMNCSDMMPVVKNNLEDSSNVILNVQSLKSGIFREVDGKIYVQKKISVPDNLLQSIEEKTFLYKVNERNVKVFAKGEFGVK